MSNRISLSVCIATMNRGPFIGATLESIISQATDEVEIVIVDGASADNTEAVVRECERRFPRLRYHRLAENGGFDQDYCRAVELATGEYCWLFTDDDLLKPGAIAAVLSQISQKYGLLIVNCDVWNADFSDLLEARRLHVNGDREYRADEVDELFVDTADYLSFIGGVVIRRAVWEVRDKESYWGTMFHHVGVIFQAPIPGGTRVLASPRISLRYGNSLWTPRSFEISLFKWPQLVWSFHNLSDAAKARVTPQNPWDSLTALLIYRARGAFSVAQYRSFVASRAASRFRRALARVIAALPGPVLNLALLLYMNCFGRRHSQPGVRIVDLQTSRYHYRQLFTRLAATTRWRTH